MPIHTLKTDTDLIQLLPLVLNYARSTNYPIHKALIEISSIQSNPNSLGLYYKEGDVVSSYIIGGLTSPGEFFITQWYSDDPHSAPTLIGEFERRVKEEFGATSISALIIYNLKIAEHRGYHFVRTLVKKEV